MSTLVTHWTMPTNMRRRSSPTSMHGQLALSTPCAQWDVRATLDHLIGATWMFALVNQGQAVGEDAGGIGDDDPVGGTHRRGRSRTSRRGGRPARSTENAPFRSAPFRRTPPP